MGWLENVERELSRARDAVQGGHHGRARTSARRAAGVAIAELQQRVPGTFYGSDFIKQLRMFAEDPSIPGDVRSSANRLQARLSENFTSLSENPLADAATIVGYIRDRLDKI